MIKNKTLATISVAIMITLLVLPVFGQDAGGPPVPDASVSVEEVVTEAVEAAKVVKEGKPEGMPTIVWVGMLMAMIGKFLLTLLRKWGKLLGKQRMRIAWLSIGVIVAVGAKLGAGTEWWEAIYLGLTAGPGSSLAHEVLKLFSVGKWAKDAKSNGSEEAEASDEEPAGEEPSES